MIGETISRIDLERTALDHALSILSPELRETMRVYFEYLHRISLREKKPLSKVQIEMVLRQFFDDGANVLIDKFNKKLEQLKVQAA